MFPQSEPIKLGNLNAAGYSNNRITFKSNTSNNTHVPATSLRNIMPRTHFRYQQNQKSINQMFDYLHALEGIQVDYDLISQCLKDEIAYNQITRKYDKFSGNRLHVYDHQSSLYLAVARKEIMNELCIYEMEERDKITIPKQLHQKIHFKTPIYQIESNKQYRFIRTLHGVHTNEIDSTDYTTLKLDTEILNFANNPHVSSSKEVLLREITKGNITDLTKHPKEQFQFAFTNNSTTTVMDSRFCKHPLLEWNISHMYEHQTNIKYFPKAISDAFSSSLYTWGRYYGDIISYSYDQSDSHPKSVHYQNYTSFKEHLLVKDRSSAHQYYDYIPNARNVDAAIENSFESPHWDLLYGVEFIQVNNNVTLLQLTETGELFAQGYKFGEPSDFDPELENRLQAIESKCQSKLQSLNSKIQVPNFHAEHKEIPLGNLLYSKPMLMIEWQTDLQNPTYEWPVITRKRKYTPKLKLELPTPDIYTKYEKCSNANFTKLIIDKNVTSKQQLPKSRYLFNQDYKEYSIKRFEKDLLDSSQICTHSKFQHDITLYGGPESHSSTITNPILGEKQLFGMPSWLLEQWQADVPFEALDNNTKPSKPTRYKTQKKAIPESQPSSRVSSSQPPIVTSKRSLSQSKSVLEIQDIRASRPNPMSAQELIAQVPVKMVHGRKVSCNGGNPSFNPGGGALGHPKVYINLDTGKPMTCGYCGLRFQQEEHH
ncbi:hypothetical protein HDV06_002311 [Boothiomyces sp. JEL0866]|nr:hypothetical protein HDV06_002311 [Boothiomyces sp. JEL0866]